MSSKYHNFTFWQSSFFYYFTIIATTTQSIPHQHRRQQWPRAKILTGVNFPEATPLNAVKSNPSCAQKYAKKRWVWIEKMIRKWMPVWPDLAKLRHFDQIFKVLGIFRKRHYALGIILNLLWQMFDGIGQIFIGARGQILNK